MRNSARSIRFSATLLTVAAVVTVIAVVTALGARGSDANAPFSRSRWFAANAERLRLDGGLLPAPAGWAEAVEADREARLSRRRPRPNTDGPPNVRISADILEHDPQSSAQAESEAEASLAINPENERHLVAGYQEGRFADGGARVLTAAVSRDGGVTWTEGVVPGLSRASGGPFERTSDPWVAFGLGGRVYFASIVFDETRPNNGIAVSASSDGGASWGAPVFVHENFDRDFDDKEAIIVDNAPDSPYRGRVYVVWDTVVSASSQVVRVASSDDGGATWSEPIAVSADGQNVGVLPLVGPRGVLHLLWMSFHDRVSEIRTARSTDGGVSWTEPITLAYPRTRGLEMLRTGGVVAAAIDPRNGTLHAVWPDERFTPGADQIVLSSSEDGRFWTAPIRVSDGPSDAPCFTPSVAVNGQGRLGVSYATLRNDPERKFLVDQYLVTSDARGRLTAAGRISTRTFDIRDAAFARGYFLGDYQGLVAGRKAFHPVWVATSEASRRRAGKQSDVVGLILQ